jgi:hypothetical protein
MEMTTGADAPPAPEPTDGHRRLDALIGVWRSEGETVDGARVAGTDTYAWLPGGFFVLHTVAVRLGADAVDVLEVIGFDPAAGRYPTTVFDGRRGTTAAYQMATADGATWTITGDAERTTLVVAAGGATMEARWERRDEAGSWGPWMTMRFRRTAAGGG